MTAPIMPDDPGNPELHGDEGFDVLSTSYFKGWTATNPTTPDFQFEKRATHSL